MRPFYHSSQQHDDFVPRTLKYSSFDGIGVRITTGSHCNRARTKCRYQWFMIRKQRHFTFHARNGNRRSRAIKECLADRGDDTLKRSRHTVLGNHFVDASLHVELAFLASIMLAIENLTERTDSFRKSDVFAGLASEYFGH